MPGAGAKEGKYLSRFYKISKKLLIKYSECKYGYVCKTSMLSSVLAKKLRSLREDKVHVIQDKIKTLVNTIIRYSLLFLFTLFL